MTRMGTTPSTTGLIGGRNKREDHLLHRTLHRLWIVQQRRCRRRRRPWMWILAAYCASFVFYPKLFGRQSVPYADELITDFAYVPTTTTTTTTTGEASLQHQEKKVYCLGFRRTGQCRGADDQSHYYRWILFNHLGDLSCDELIPPTASGYCEYQFANGTSFSIFHKRSCISFKLAKAASCRMVVDFYNYKVEAQAYKYPTTSSQTQSQQQRQQQQQSSYVTLDSSKVQKDMAASGRGIVMAVYPDVLLSVYAILNLLRTQHGCQLSVELWSMRNEAMDDKASFPLFHEILQLPNVYHRIVVDDDEPSISGFMVKPYAIFSSQFDEVLWLDADNIPLRDPTYLFESEVYQQTGTLFFKDYWQPDDSIFFLNRQSLVWELLGIPYRYEFEMESGQLLLNKRTTQEALHKIMFLTTTYHKRWLGPLALLWGDKDLFRMGFYMANDAPISWVNTPPSTVGYYVSADDGMDSSTNRKKTLDKLKQKSNGFSTCGVCMVQHDTNGQPLFMHRNSFKLTTDANTQQSVWQSMYEFVGSDASSQYRIASTKDKQRRLTCYHPAAHVSQYFQEKNITKTSIAMVERQFLAFVQTGMKFVV